ncbi:MAG: twin-arginine translocase TatA/TatE family subunit [Melioribacteraceae bacterium]|nr:twin-arginine translocase TatA/TatE family subunit [Melioribacteraceae bacterium]
MFANLGWPEMLLIGIVFIILFGSKKLPEVARNMGKGIKEFKKTVDDVKEEFDVTKEIRESVDKVKDQVDITKDFKL